MNEIISLIKDNNIKYDLLDNKVIIYNKNNKYIEVIKDNEDEYLVSFETQHCHLNDIDDIFNYIERIRSDDLLPIEFYLDDKRKFGGDISKEMFNELSINSLVDYFGFDEDTLSNYNYEVHSWSGKYDVERQPVRNLMKGDNNG